MLLNFPDILLSAAIWGHVFVALARLAGFRLLRNTWRPLSSRTVAEFWNRYMYYFKETLVHFYFYPTFLTCFKRHPRLRLAFATFMAAGVGNLFLHLIVDRVPIVRYGLMEALMRMQTYAFYCFCSPRVSRSRKCAPERQIHMQGGGAAGSFPRSALWLSTVSCLSSMARCGTYRYSNASPFCARVSGSIDGRK